MAVSPKFRNPQASVEAAERHMQLDVREHRDSYAGRWLSYEAGAPTLVVAFTGVLEPHRSALALPRVEVVAALAARRSSKEHVTHGGVRTISVERV